MTMHDWARSWATASAAAAVASANAPHRIIDITFDTIVVTAIVFHHFMPAADAFLPLTPTVLHILLSLADGDKHGYAIIKEVRRRTEGDVELGASSLYAVMKRIVADRLVAETDERPDPALDDERRRYYRLTPLGKATMLAELRRLESILTQARAKRLVLKPR
jgi:DNA-binding PadR family transcriptional regulator